MTEITVEQLADLLKKHSVRGGLVDARNPQRTTIDAGIDLIAVAKDLNVIIAGRRS